MLAQLHIRGFTLIDELTLDVGAGFNVLTGETGAGKSILLDALSLTLGARADTSWIGPKHDKAAVSACFDLEQAPLAQHWLAQNDLDEQNECIVRRVITRNGRSRAYINGTVVPVQWLRELGAHLVAIHGQHAQQRLLQRSRQRRVLDEFGQHLDVLAKVEASCEQWRDLSRQRDELAGKQQQHDQRNDYLRFQLSELNDFAPNADEYGDLLRQHERLVHRERLVHWHQQVITRLDDDSDAAIMTQLGLALRDLEKFAAKDARAQSALEHIVGAEQSLRDALGVLQHLQAEDDDVNVDQVEERLAKYQQLARKYRVAEDDLAALQQRLSAEATQLESLDEHLERLDEQLREALRDYRQLAGQLREKRRAAAKRLSKAISQALPELGMAFGKFHIDVQTGNDTTAPQRSGDDDVTFLIATNRGAAPQPLADIASGGELSRVSLALELHCQHCRATPTNVFDEVDAGIGGGIAEAVGRKLALLAHSRQVLCVTHLPQVAALAHSHFKVMKEQRKTGAQSTISALDTQQRQEELARMLGGIEITSQTRAHAREMLDQGRLFNEETRQH